MTNEQKYKTTESVEKPKPCPFCGGTTEVIAEAAQVCGEIGEMVGREAACHQPVTDCQGLGNTTKMSEALERTQRVLHCAIVAEKFKGDDAQEALNVVTTALDAPPRNCDIGTPEEQSDRFYAFCGNHRFQSGIKGICSSLCPCIMCRDMCHCLTKWSQMPYEKGWAK